MALTSDNKKKYYCLSLAREGCYYAWYGVRYDDSTVDVHDDQEHYATKDVIEASEWLMDHCDPAVIYDFCFFEVAITSEIIPIFEERRPVVHAQ
ncbi:hypothetical protein AAVH_22921 [Aphelenchoides avenae]|nr:hypothetical protein AAVH_22921 [Aphelenchus avenae]